MCVCEDWLLFKFEINFMAEELESTDPLSYPGEINSLGTGPYEMGLGDAGESQDELDQLHGEYAEIGSPADEEATKLRVNKLVAEMDAETDPAKKLELITNFVLVERVAASEVAVRLTVARGVTDGESFVESMRRAGATDNSFLADK